MGARHPAALAVEGCWGNRGCANLAVTSLGNFVSARLATAHSWNPPRLRYFKQFSYHLASEGVLCMGTPGFDLSGG